MKNVPEIFGHPFWCGKIKRRVAKKILNRKRYNLMRYFFKNRSKFINPNMLVNDCTGYNGAVLETDPVYRRLGKGWILVDVDMTTANTSCSLTHCGIKPELTQSEIEARKKSFIKNWTLGEPGRKWYGDNPDERSLKQIELAKKQLAILEAGGHITDERGRVLPEFTSTRHI